MSKRKSPSIRGGFKLVKCDCDTHMCKTCLFRQKFTEINYKDWSCGYLYFMGHMRNSDPSHCDKWRKYNQKERNALVAKSRKQVIAPNIYSQLDTYRHECYVKNEKFERKHKMKA